MTGNRDLVKNRSWQEKDKEWDGDWRRGEGKVEEEHKTRMRWMAIIRTEVPMGIFLAIVAGWSFSV